MTDQANLREALEVVRWDLLELTDHYSCLEIEGVRGCGYGCGHGCGIRELSTLT